MSAKQTKKPTVELEYGTTKFLNDDNTIKVVTVEQAPRYVGILNRGEDGSLQYIIDDGIDEIKEGTKICILATNNREGFNILDNYQFRTELTGDLEKDLQLFQDDLDNHYGKGKYEAYTLGAYIHSGVSFSIQKGNDNRCPWDSGIIGFIGLPTDENEGYLTDPSRVRSLLTDYWMGDLADYQVYDNYTDEVVDSYLCIGYDKECYTWKVEQTNKYGINWEEVEKNAR